MLDEIGELPLDLQPKLLRVLETGRLRRVGGAGEIGVRVRVVAMTLRDLAGDVQRRSFRDDLYYRLAGLLPAAAAAARAPRRHPAAGRAFPARGWPAEIGERQLDRVRAGGAGGGGCSPATCASCATPSAAPRSCPPAASDGRIDAGGAGAAPRRRRFAWAEPDARPAASTRRRWRRAAARRRHPHRRAHVRRDRARGVRVGAAPKRRQPAARRARASPWRAPPSATR